MSSLSFDRLREVNMTRCARWHPGFPDDELWSGADWSNAMAGEAGEACNIVKKIRRHESGVLTAHNPELEDLKVMLGDEIADTVCYGDLLAAKYGIDLGGAVVKKFNFISRREGYPERLP